MRVVLAEDQFLLREGLTRLLQSHGLDVVAVSTGPDIDAAIRDSEPDLAVLDIRLPPSFSDEGLRAALRARMMRSSFPVVLLSQYVERLYAHELLASGEGGVGYLLKDRVFDDEQFVATLRTVAAGGTVMDPEVVSQLIASQTSATRLDRLTARETEVLGLIAEGHSNSAIAGRLFVTDKAVAKHINSILAKLDLPPSETAHRRVLAVLAYLGA